MDSSDLNELQGLDKNGFRPRKTGPIPVITQILLLLLTVTFMVIGSPAPLSLYGLAMLGCASALLAFMCAALPLGVWNAVLALGISGALGLLANQMPEMLPTMLGSCVGGLALLRLLRRRARRNTAIAWLCAIFLLSGALWAALYLRGALRDAIDWTQLGAGWTTELENRLSEAGLDSSMAETYVRYALSLTPAFCMVVGMLYGWICTAVFGWLCRLFFRDRLLRAPAWRVEMSGVSAGVFLGALLIGLVSSGAQLSPVPMSAMNLLVLLLPGFFVEGFRLLRTMLRQRRSGGLSALAVVGAALLLFLNSSAFLMMIAISGAVSVLADAIRSRPRAGKE